MSIEDRLARLRELERAPLSDDTIEELSKALSLANNVLIARAARVAGNRNIVGLIPNLVAAFERLIKKSVEGDKGCLAKLAIIEALNDLDYDDEEIFLQGIHYVQKEFAYGGPVDTAVEIRSKCAFALTRIRYPDTLFEFATLLVDPEPQARAVAAKATAHLAGVESELLLRMKVLTGDQESEVLAECLSGLISINPERSMSFVSGFLASDDSLIIEAAVLALGESRRTDAFEILRDYREDNIIEPELQKALLLSIALTRVDEAFEYLINVISDEHRSNAIKVLEALKIFCSNDDLRARIHEAVVSRDDVAVSETWGMLEASLD